MIKEARDGMAMSADTTVFMKPPEKSPTALMALSREWRNKMAKEKNKSEQDTDNTQLIISGFTALTNALTQDRESSDKKFTDLYDRHDKLKTKVIIIAVVQKGILAIFTTMFGGLVAWLAMNM